MNFNELEVLLKVWKSRLGLDTWRIKLIFGGVQDETSYMEVEHSIYYERAVINVSPWFVGQGEIPEDALMRDAITDDFVEASLVHELLHLHTRNIKSILKHDVKDLVNRDLYEQLMNAMERHEEQTVDRLAEALVRAFKEIEND